MPSVQRFSCPSYGKRQQPSMRNIDRRRNTWQNADGRRRRFSSAISGKREGESFTMYHLPCQSAWSKVEQFTAPSLRRRALHMMALVPLHETRSGVVTSSGNANAAGISPENAKHWTFFGKTPFPSWGNTKQ